LQNDSECKIVQIMFIYLEHTELFRCNLQVLYVNKNGGLNY